MCCLLNLVDRTGIGMMLVESFGSEKQPEKKDSLQHPVPPTFIDASLNVPDDLIMTYKLLTPLENFFEKTDDRNHQSRF